MKHDARACEPLVVTARYDQGPGAGRIEAKVIRIYGAPIEEIVKQTRDGEELT